MKLFVFVFSFAIVCGNNKDLIRIDSIQNEPECLSEGGICVVAADCPPGKLSEIRGLCPQQQKKGIECCYGMSVKETRCRKYGGECNNGTLCNENLVVKEATDCLSGTLCCIFV